MAGISLKTSIPGPQSRAWRKRRRAAVAAGLAEPIHGVVLREGRGALVTDVDGNTFIDFTGGIGAMNVGHSNPAVLAAARRQLSRLQHTCFMTAMHEPYVRLAEKLASITPGRFKKKSFFANSGAEAVENAVKISRRATGRGAVIAFEHAFHGRTLLAMTLTSKTHYKHGMGPFAPEVYRAPLGDLDALRRMFKTVVAPEAVAAMVLEPVVGEGGFLIPPAGFVRGVAELCRENGIVFVADEVQTGFGRTGRMFASEHFGVEPDLVVMAKSLSAGFPLGAVTGRATLLDAVHVGGLGTTFGGNPVACAAALASIDFIEKRKLAARANEIGRIVMKRLAKLGPARGLGAMCAVETPDAQKATLACARRGLLILSCGTDGNVLRTLMPLTITDAQLDEGLDVLDSVLR